MPATLEIMNLKTFRTDTLTKFLKALEQENSNLKEEINQLVAKQEAVKNEINLISTEIRDRTVKPEQQLKISVDQDLAIKPISFKSLTWEGKVEYVMQENASEYMTSPDILEEIAKKDQSLNTSDYNSRRKIMKRISSALGALVRENKFERVADESGQFKYKNIKGAHGPLKNDDKINFTT